MRAGDGGGARRPRPVRRSRRCCSSTRSTASRRRSRTRCCPGVENGWVILVAATTENPSFSVIAPLLSRSLLLTLEPLERRRPRHRCIDRAVDRPARPRRRGRRSTDDARAAIIRLASGDARRALTALEAAAVVAAAPRDDAEPGETPVVTAEIVAAAVDRALLRYDRQGDEHYDVISAFIKSVRGSDVDAVAALPRPHDRGGGGPALHRPPHHDLRRRGHRHGRPAGARRSRSPRPRPSQLIGMPEGRILLAEAVVYLATAPKSNASYMALDAAIADVRAGKIGRVPKPPARRALPGREAARPRQGLPVRARRRVRGRRAAVPARRAAGHRATTTRRATATSGTCGAPGEDARPARRQADAEARAACGDTRLRLATTLIW